MKLSIYNTIGLIGMSVPAWANQPDIVLIITDQQTASAMSCAGNPLVKTPAMDELAKDGVMFNRAYVSYPLSGPSRASLFTGKTPGELGIRDNNDTLRTKDRQESLGFQLSAAGYRCLYAGKWHIPQVNIPEEGTGFEKICNMHDPTLVEQIIPYLQQKHNKPVFLVASFLNPHEICEYARGESLPYGNLPEPALEDCPNLPPNFPEPAYYPEALSLHKAFVPKSYPTGSYSDDDWRRYLYAYYRLVERVDTEIGKLIAALKANNKYDNSLILFVSDHGDGVAAHRWNQKRSLQEEVIRVPFIAKPPQGKGIKNVKNEKALVNTSLDIFQTVCDYAETPKMPALQGKSIRPILEGKADSLHSYIYVETLLDGIDTRAWCVMDNNSKYVLYRYYKNREQLFNLAEDSGEMVNLIGDKQQKETLNRLRSALYDWGVKTNDSFLIRQLKPIIK